MIIKAKDDPRTTEAAIQEILALKTLSKKQRAALEEEAGHLWDGIQGGKLAAHSIDTHLQRSNNWAVIHDLRIEFHGRVAQIDHLLIGRFFDIFVIESKNCKTPLRVDSHGEFEIKTRLGWTGMASPIEQNRRHIIVLNDLIRKERLTPMRLGVPIKPAYRSWVLVSPECRVPRRHLDEAIILKTDIFDLRLEEFTHRVNIADDVLSIARVSSSETIMHFARKLVSFHRPASFDFAGKLGVTRTLAPAEPLAPMVCCQCGGGVDSKVAAICRFNTHRFGERLLCRKCQARAPSAPRSRALSRRLPARTGGGRGLKN
jgi:hypothetical protein